jgi:hypothetical protein
MLMKKISIVDGIIQWPIERGQNADIVINWTQGWDLDDIKMEIKSRRQILDPALIELTLGSGLEIDGQKLRCSLTHHQTSLFAAPKLVADLKLVQDGRVLPAVPITLIISQTVTNI